MGDCDECVNMTYDLNATDKLEVAQKLRAKLDAAERLTAMAAYEQEIARELFAGVKSEDAAAVLDMHITALQVEADAEIANIKP